MVDARTILHNALKADDRDLAAGGEDDEPNHPERAKRMRRAIIKALDALRALENCELKATLTERLFCNMHGGYSNRGEDCNLRYPDHLKGLQ